MHRLLFAFVLSLVEATAPACPLCDGARRTASLRRSPGREAATPGLLVLVSDNLRGSESVSTTSAAAARVTGAYDLACTVTRQSQGRAALFQVHCATGKGAGGNLAQVCGSGVRDDARWDDRDAHGLARLTVRLRCSPETPP